MEHDIQVASIYEKMLEHRCQKLVLDIIECAKTPNSTKDTCKDKFDLYMKTCVKSKLKME